MLPKFRKRAHAQQQIPCKNEEKQKKNERAVTEKAKTGPQDPQEATEDKRERP